MRSLIVMILGVSLLASSCATKAGTGTAVGAGGGGLVGYAIGGGTGAVVGALLGGVVGYGVGREMDEEDRRRAAYALEHNRTMGWRNAHGDEYRLSPTHTHRIDGRECRDYRLMAEVDGKPENITGTACRRSDGSWESIST